MPAKQAFYVYHVIDAEGAMKHSSILYEDDLADKAATTSEIRESLLISAGYASGEYEFTHHGDDPKGLTIELFGPFVKDEPIARMTDAEYVALPEDQIP